MKLKMNCPKCGSEKISIVENEESMSPMYKCEKCGYKGRLFPKFESDKEIKENADEDDMDENDEEELNEDEETDQF